MYNQLKFLSYFTFIDKEKFFQIRMLMKSSKFSVPESVRFPGY
jgi:hypothetical protein